MRIINEFQAIDLRSEIPDFLRRHGMHRRICEVGVRFGYHLRQLMNCEPSLAVGVDLWTDDGVPAHNDTGMNQRALDTTYQQVFRDMLLDPRVKLFRGYSTGAAACIPDHFFDFIYIDAGHTREECWNDLNAWWRKLRSGGMLAGHDYVKEDAKNGVPFGVIEAVDDFVKARGIPPELFHVTKTGRRSWMILKLEGE